MKIFYNWKTNCSQFDDMLNLHVHNCGYKHVLFWFCDHPMLCYFKSVKVKSSMARSLPVENLLRQNVCSIINYLQKFTKVAQWGAPSFIQPQPATDNGVRDGRSNWLVELPTLHRAVLPELHVLHTAMGAASCKSQDLLHWESLDRAPSECQTNALPVRPLRVWTLTKASMLQVCSVKFL